MALNTSVHLRRDAGGERRRLQLAALALAASLHVLLFVGVMVWSWSKRRASEFEEAAQLPFLDEPAEHPQGEKR